MALKRMLIDASHPEETRVVVVDGNRLEDYDVEVAARRQLKGNIYLAKVTRVEPSLQAAFVDYGGNRHGFLAYNEIHPDYYQIPVADRERLLAEHAAAERYHSDEGEEAEGAEPLASDDEDDFERRRVRPSPRHYKIQEVIKRRQIMLVQVAKEERGNKGAALTTYLSLAGRYCVLMPNTVRGGGISRKISGPTDRKRLKKIIAELEVPDGMAVIVRTAGAGHSKAEIKRDYEYLMRLWATIREQTLASTAPALVYEEASLIKRSIRDLYGRDIEEIVVQGDEAYRTAKEFMKLFISSHAKRVKPYENGERPLFQAHNLEDQLDAIHQPIVQLRSGGYIVINPTEALVAIDVNSGRSTRERNIEETALRTNLEAADEIARQLRLRDLAGLIVLDFIDMESPRNQGMVERRLKEAMKNDRARVQIGRISPFGLLELSRQRLRPSLLETSFEVCQACSGAGLKRTTESTALAILRHLEDEGMRQRAAEISVTLPPAVALYLLNQKRRALVAIEERHDMSVLILEDANLVPPDHRLERLRLRTHEEEAAEAAEEEPEVEAAAAGDAPAGERDEARRGRRRRPRRRRRDEDIAAPAEYAEAEAVEAADDEALEAEDAEEGSEPDSLDDRGEDAEAGEGEAGEAGAGESGPEAAAEDSPRRRRRRGKRGGRRRARSSAATGPAAEEEATADGEPVGADADEEEEDVLPWSAQADLDESGDDESLRRVHVAIADDAGDEREEDDVDADVYAEAGDETGDDEDRVGGSAEFIEAEPGDDADRVFTGDVVGGVQPPLTDEDELEPEAQSVDERDVFEAASPPPVDAAAQSAADEPMPAEPVAADSAAADYVAVDYVAVDGEPAMGEDVAAPAAHPRPRRRGGRRTKAQREAEAAEAEAPAAPVEAEAVEAEAPAVLVEAEAPAAPVEAAADAGEAGGAPAEAEATDTAEPGEPSADTPAGDEVVPPDAPFLAPEEGVSADAEAIAAPTLTMVVPEDWRQVSADMPVPSDSVAETVPVAEAFPAWDASAYTGDVATAADSAAQAGAAPPDATDPEPAATTEGDEPTAGEAPWAPISAGEGQALADEVVDADAESPAEIGRQPAPAGEDIGVADAASPSGDDTSRPGAEPDDAAPDAPVTGETPIVPDGPAGENGDPAALRQTEVVRVGEGGGNAERRGWWQRTA